MSAQPALYFNRIQRFLRSPRAYIQDILHWTVPAGDSITLTRKNIGILPGRSGLGFLFVILLLWLVATNYENNLVMALMFTLISLFVVSIFYTFANLAHLKITYLKSHPCFLGEQACFELLIEGEKGRSHEAIRFTWDGATPIEVSLTDNHQHYLKLFVPAGHRGRFKPGRLLVESYYPLGLIRAWVRLDMNCETLVYPKPTQAGPLPSSQEGDGEGDLGREAGNEDFHGFQNYQPGDSLRKVAWKQYARGGGLYTKEYAAAKEESCWLDWDFLAGLGREARLSRLCYWALEAHKGNELFGLRLPYTSIQPGRGENHRDQVLEALALFEWEQAELEAKP